MKRRVVSIAGPVVLCMLVSCGTVQPGGGAAHHSLEFRNEGVAPVRRVAIRYGEYVLPRGSLSYEIVPGADRIEIRAIPVPKAVEISWQSADGMIHSSSCELRTKVDKSEKFAGFAFVFRDGSVEVQQVRSMLVGGRVDRLVRVPLCTSAG